MSTTKLSREEHRKLKDLEEARKAGKEPAELDAQGNEINPHIPLYMSKAPWYINSGEPGLDHQRRQKEENKQRTFHPKQTQLVSTSNKYRKGACKNCGAMTHKDKDCVERPRKKGAKWTNQEIKPDEIFNQTELDYDGKRDRWNGYDTSQYLEITKTYDLIEEERKKKKAKDLEMGINEEESDVEEDEKYAENTDMPGQKIDKKNRTTVRNLRIREDTAKYLRNLDPNSAFYDPKTRSMRENPNLEKDPLKVDYAGDNFMRHSGDAPKHAQLQLFAWDQNQSGTQVHLEGNPTMGEAMYKKFKEENEKSKKSIKKSILDKYGGEEHLTSLVDPDMIVSAQSEIYVEYDRSGQIVKGVEKAIAKSKYNEDYYMNNHTSVWGSFYSDGKWAYRCCHSVIKSSYCIPIDNQ